MVSLRTRNRLNAMRLTQRTALPLFYERGFDAVTVGEVAEHVGLAASTIYRHFETKEALVLWDEHDPEIDAAIGARLGRQPPLEAIRDALIESLGARYDDEVAFQLPRVKYIFATEGLHRAAFEADIRARSELSEAVASVLPKREASKARIIAGAAMLALDVALDDWQSTDAKRRLKHHLAAAFTQLESL